SCSSARSPRGSSRWRTSASHRPPRKRQRERIEMEAASAAGSAVSLDDQTVIKPAIHHVNLKTARLDAMIEWYGKALGMEPNFRSEIIAFLSNDGANHRIALTALPGFQSDPEKLTRDGMHHIAF